MHIRKHQVAMEDHLVFSERENAVGCWLVGWSFRMEFSGLVG